MDVVDERSITAEITSLSEKMMLILLQQGVKSIHIVLDAIHYL